MFNNFLFDAPFPTLIRMQHPRAQLSTSKQARSAATRIRLLDAALDCLAESGYAGSSTAMVARRAGVSQGAVYKHFPSKSVLWAMAAAHLFTEMREGFVPTVMQRLAGGDADPIDAALDVLWAIYCDPRLHGVFELYLAARTDAEIAAVLTPVMAEHQAGITAIATTLFPHRVEQRAQIEPLLWALLNTLQGAALMRQVNPNAGERPIEFEFIKQQVRQILGAPTLPTVLP